MAGVTRRRFLGVCGGISASLALGARQAGAQGGFNWRRFQGERIRVLVYSLGWTEFAKRHIPEFERLTGIKVDYEMIPGAAVAAYAQKLNVEFAAKSDAIGVYISYHPQFTVKHLAAGWVEPLDGYVRDAQLTSPEFDLADFSRATISTGTFQDKLLGIAFTVDVGALFYRKDVLGAVGLKPPETFEQLIEVAKRVHKPGEMAGYVARGRGRDAVNQWGIVYFGMGGTWFNRAGKVSINNPEGLAALEYYGGLLRQYGPTGIVNYSRLDAQNLFAGGRAAMWMEGAEAAAILQNPAKTPVSDRIGYAVVPGGKVGPKPSMIGLHLSISPFTKPKGACWYFIQWATGKDLTRRALLEGTASPRKSTWSDPEFKAKVGAKYPDWVETEVRSYELGNQDWLPPIERAQEARDVIGGTITAAIEGQDFKAAAAAADAKLATLT